MKRSGIQRGTKEWKRRKPMPLPTKQMKRTALVSKRYKSIPEDVRFAVAARSGGRCEAVVNERCQGYATAVHHRLRRSHGGKNALTNLLGVCTFCHQYIHDHPAESFEHGWLIRGA